MASQSVSGVVLPSPNSILDIPWNFPISFSSDNYLKEVEKVSEYFMAVLPYVTDDFDSIYPTTADHFCWRFAWLLREGTCGDTQRWLQALQLFRYTYTKQQLSLNLWRLAVFYRIVQDYQTFLRLSGLYDWIV